MTHEEVAEPSVGRVRRRLAAACVAWLVWLLPWGAAAHAAEVRVAVAANFSDAAQQLAAVFQKQTGHVVRLSSGASGQLYTQICQGAPFEVLLSADRERPELAVRQGLAVPASRFTYAIGQLVLWSKDPGRVQGEATLAQASFSKLALANPETAPYGAAAVEVLKALELYAALEPKLVRGNNIAQAFQFVDTGNAELGFVALSQLRGDAAGSRWQVPQSLYTPLRQDAVLLKAGARNEAAVEFLRFLRSAPARAAIERFGYAVDPG